MDKLLAIGKTYNVPVIEDTAEAIGATYRGKRAGSMGRLGTFSFHGTKTLTTGEGGIFVTNDTELFESVLTLSNHDVLTAYKTKLSGYQGISLNPEPAGTVNGAWMPTAVFNPELGITRDMLLEAFKAQNIDARVIFYPLSGLSFFEDTPENVNAWDIPERAINLPSFHGISDLKIERVCNVIKSLVKL